jgi:hypothetical protein
MVPMLLSTLTDPEFEATKLGGNPPEPADFEVHNRDMHFDSSVRSLSNNRKMIVADGRFLDGYRRALLIRRALFPQMSCPLVYRQAGANGDSPLFTGRRSYVFVHRLRITPHRLPPPFAQPFSSDL